MNQQTIGWLIVAASILLWALDRFRSPGGQLYGITGWLGGLFKRAAPVTAPTADHSASDLVYQFEILQTDCLKYGRSQAVEELHAIFPLLAKPDPLPPMPEIVPKPAEPTA